MPQLAVFVTLLFVGSVIAEQLVEEQVAEFKPLGTSHNNNKPHHGAKPKKQLHKPKSKRHSKTPTKPAHRKQPTNTTRPAVVGDSLTSIGYNTNTGERYLFYSYAAYCSDSSITSWSCEYCSSGSAALSDLTLFSDSATNTFGFVGYNAGNNEIVCSFRGTVASSLQDWIDDLSFSYAQGVYPDIPGAHVHSGFYGCYTALKNAAQSAVNALQAEYPDADVYYTGHSLGGAIATLAHVDGVINWDVSASQSNSFTFGSPRVGDATFATGFSNEVGWTNHYRVVNNRDIVPHLPLEILGYHHICTEVWLHSGKTTICNQSGEDPSCSDSLLLATSVSDHLSYYGYQQEC